MDQKNIFVGGWLMTKQIFWTNWAGPEPKNWQRIGNESFPAEK